jgi:hypothetical protein
MRLQSPPTLVAVCQHATLVAGSSEKACKPQTFVIRKRRPHSPRNTPESRNPNLPGEICRRGVCSVAAHSERHPCPRSFACFAGCSRTRTGFWPADAFSRRGGRRGLPAPPRSPRCGPRCRASRRCFRDVFSRSSPPCRGCRRCRRCSCPARPTATPRLRVP